LVLLVVLAQPLQRARQVLALHLRTLLQFGDVEDLLWRNPGVALDVYLADARQLSRSQPKDHVHLPRVLVRFQFVSDGRLVVSVVAHHFGHALHRLLDVVFGEQFSQVELAGVNQLVRLGESLGIQSIHIDVAVEIVLRGDKRKDDAAGLRRISLHVQAGKSPRGIQHFDRLAQRVAIQRFARLYQQQAAQHFRIGPRNTAKLHFAHRFVLVLARSVQLRSRMLLRADRLVLRTRNWRRVLRPRQRGSERQRDAQQADPEDAWSGWLPQTRDPCWTRQFPDAALKAKCLSCTLGRPKTRAAQLTVPVRVARRNPCGVTYNNEGCFSKA